MIKERTFYRYIAKIYETDQAIFVAESERESSQERERYCSIQRQELLALRWCVAIRENVNSDIAVEAQYDAPEVALALLKLEQEGRRIMHKEY